MTGSPWIKRPRPVPEAEVRLFCLPHAGAGPSFFARWVTELSSSFEVCLVHLPGREARMAELPIDDLEVIATRVAEQARPLLDRPFAFFGHSMGAVIAYEVVHQLPVRPRQLFVSASAPPHCPSPEPRIAHLPDADFLTAVRRGYAGIPDALWHDQQLLRLLLPALRADFAACERYQWQPRPPLDCPITALGGAADPFVPDGSLARWGELTTGDCTVRVLGDGHFYLVDDRAAVHRCIREQLEVAGVRHG
jgi:medium-chain acyl-[acyl-carrier-protein] hydrolase